MCPVHALFDVAGRVALVTGSSRGIGRALAGGLAAAGATVVLNGRDPDAVAAARETLAEETGGTVHAAAFDVTDSAAIAAAVAEIEETVGPIDILVNNAGVQNRTPILAFPDDEWHRLVDTNLGAAFRVGPRGRPPHAAARPRQDRQHVLGAERGRPAGHRGLRRHQGRAQDADEGDVRRPRARPASRSTGSGPGYIATELTAPLIADPEFDAWIRARTPAGRWGSVDDLVGPLLFLVSPAADYVNGQILTVDGGMLAVL